VVWEGFLLVQFVLQDLVEGEVFLLTVVMEVGLSNKLMGYMGQVVVLQEDHPFIIKLVEMVEMEEWLLNGR
jgi:hypothetical protein